MKCEICLLAPPCVKSGKLAVRGWTLLQSTWALHIYEDILQSPTKFCFPVQWEKSGHTDHDQLNSAVMIKQLPVAVNRGAVGESRTSGRMKKNSVRKTGERYKHREEKSGSVRWGPWKFRPSTAYGAFQPPNTSSWPMRGYSSAVPGCHNSVGQIPREDTILRQKLEIQYNKEICHLQLKKRRFIRLSSKFYYKPGQWSADFITVVRVHEPSSCPTDYTFSFSYRFLAKTNQIYNFQSLFWKKSTAFWSVFF